MDKKVKTILYIGPYNEESNRGRVSLNNIKGLHKAGHRLKIVPTSFSNNRNKETPSDLIFLEKANIEHYDICIQHCEPANYSFNSSFEKNIGIFGCKNIEPETVVHTRLGLLDNFIVHSQKIYNGLSRNITRNISKNMVYCPTYIDLDHIKNCTKDKLDWADSKKYYFYTEIEFTDEYDWEKLIYVYFTTFKHKSAGLIIKTTQIADDSEASEINEKINNIAICARVVPNNDNIPRVLNGVFDENNTIMVYNTVDCFIDCGRTHEYNSNLFIAAALKKDIVCNTKLAASDFFPQTYQVNAHPCNINFVDSDNVFSSTIYETNYTMQCGSLQEQLILAYNNRHVSQKSSDEELQKYDISNINALLC